MKEDTILILKTIRWILKIEDNPFNNIEDNPFNIEDNPLNIEDNPLNWWRKTPFYYWRHRFNIENA